MTVYIKPKKFSQARHNRGVAILNVLIIFSIICLFFIYLIQVNGLVGKNYQMREQKKHLEELQAENEILEMEIVQGRSPANLEEIAKSLGMIKVGQVVYLEKEKIAAAVEQINE